ncbi:uncharacterized protein CCOS01_08790 [Colletotrichum costaricense]|uniref:Uncharacterized protein n=1 Tax=Colletotrichum costaricense TaxID=1209916 RepID=A0AAI9YWI9_9PEZI|nr:uncharacterized protein CCOS01_08790 [Colletotrichum costaricense]KAK1526372.1 hypothetical protein CCOS01_08790 [Colletotrichum costaricense]
MVESRRHADDMTGTVTSGEHVKVDRASGCRLAAGEIMGPGRRHAGRHCHYASLSPISHRGEVGDTAGEAREMMVCANPCSLETNHRDTENSCWSDQTRVAEVVAHALSPSLQWPVDTPPPFCIPSPPLVHASPGDPAGGRGSDDKRKWLLAAVSREYFVAVEYPWEAPCRDPMLLVFPGFSDEGLGCLGGMDPERGRASERRGLYVWMQHSRWDFAGEGNQDQEERYKSNEAPAETSVSSLLSREVFLVPLQLRSQPSVDVEYGRRTHRDPSS